MNKLFYFAVNFILLFMFVAAGNNGRPGNAFAEGFLICLTPGQEKALIERGEKITKVKDDLIRRTLQAYNGDYIRSDNMTAIILNGKTYKDFTVEVVDDRYLRIQTPDDTYYMQIVSEPPPR